MTLTITFILALDPIYVTQDGRTCGLLGKKMSQFSRVDGDAVVVCTTIESKGGVDYGGDSINGTKGDRFVYFGLEQNGQWLRRWKLRQHQLDEIFAAANTDQTTISVGLGRDVTPAISPS